MKNDGESGKVIPFQKKKGESASPQKIIFRAHPFEHSGYLFDVAVVVLVLDGDWYSAIMKVREAGGIPVDLIGWRGSWFLSWPFVSVKIEQPTERELLALRAMAHPKSQILFSARLVGD